MKVVIIDGQGGKLGQKLAEAVSNSKVECELYAVGTNTVATSAMLKGGAEYAATGENAVIVACRDADVIVGPIGITVADSLLGEITPEMAKAVGQSRALKLFLPVSHCNNQVGGVRTLSLSDMVEAAVEKLKDCGSCGK